MAVTNAEVQIAIEGGAITREAVTRACRAGSDCGACHTMIEAMIEDHLEDAVAVPCCPPAASSPDRLVPEASLIRTRAA